MKKITAVILFLAMALGCAQGILAEGLGNFTHRYEYTDGVFSDVKIDSWYYDNVASVYEYGLMNGKGGGRFDPDGNITVAETCTIAARLRSIYTDGTDAFEKSSPWYKVYMDYCRDSGMLSGIGEFPEDPNEQASRGLFAAVLRNAFPEDALSEKNYVPDGSVPDVDPGDEYADAIYALYRAGVLTGSDKQGNFYPERSIKRSEVAAIITRMADPELRQHVSLAEMTLYVSPDGSDETGDGSEESPFATLSAARDAAREIDKSKCSGITVFVKAGEYKLSGSFVLDERDSGTDMCPVTYMGEEGAALTGYTVLPNSLFVKAEGETLLQFPEEVRDKLLMFDLSELGYTPGDIAAMQARSSYFLSAEHILYVGGRQMYLARYPDAGDNMGEGWLEIESGYFLDKNGEYTEKTDNDNDPEHEAVQTIVNYGQEHMERVLSWSPDDRVYARAYYRFLWVKDDSPVTEFFTDSPEMRVPYRGGYFPENGGLFFWYNVPEELDVPGECYIDDDAILYYYPSEDFDTSVITVWDLNEPIVDIRNADHINFVSLRFDSSKDNGISYRGNHLTFDGCTVCNVDKDAVSGTGDHIVVKNCEICAFGLDGLKMWANDVLSFDSGIVIYNNYIHNGTYLGGTASEGAIVISAGGAYLAHNEICDIKAMGVWIAGAYDLFEYNYLHDTCQFWTDVGALNIKEESYGSVYRYNLIARTGFLTRIDIVGVASFISDGGSGAEYYGNISYDCTGSGLDLAGCRDTSAHNNLVVRPGRYGIRSTCPDYAEIMRGNRTPEREIPEALLREDWQEAFPQIKGIYGTLDLESDDNSMFVNAPARNHTWDNFYYIDKAYRTAALVGRQPDKMFSIENYADEMSDMQVGSVKEGDMILYSSKREHYTLRECLAAANEKYGVMTEEQLGMVGRIGIGIGDFEFTN